MKKRRLGNSTIEVSEIGFGCMSLSEDIHQCEAIIKNAIEGGINFFDTADLYQYGLNEQNVGTLLKPFRKDIILATKVGNRFTTEKNGSTWDASYSYIKTAVKKSLKRLQTDYIDLYQLHGGTIEDNTEETITAFEELVKEGYIRSYGISSIRPNVIHRFLEASSIVSIMMPYNILDRRAEELFPLLKEKNVSVIVRGPLAKGLLTSKTKEIKESPLFQKGYEEYDSNELQKTITTLHNKFESLSTTAIRFSIYNDVVATAIPGASSQKQMIQNLKASTATLTKEDYEWIKSNTKMAIYKNHRM